MTSCNSSYGKLDLGAVAVTSDLTGREFEVNNRLNVPKASSYSPIFASTDERQNWVGNRQPVVRDLALPEHRIC